MLEDAISEDCEKGSETGDTGADDGYVRLESGPNTEVDAFPFTSDVVSKQ